ncbi:MAG TPA: hypothetical protein VEA58_05685 [Anaerovoracaceae bacterium]|nr:hypothetical protein [Anaerovoracaceae bacterium]
MYEKIFLKRSDGGWTIVQIHADHYDRSLQHISAMARELRKDFPNVKNEQIRVERYAGLRLKGITYLQIQVNGNAKIPESYKQVPELEPGQ